MLKNIYVHQINDSVWTAFKAAIKKRHHRAQLPDVLTPLLLKFIEEPTMPLPEISYEVLRGRDFRGDEAQAARQSTT